MREMSAELKNRILTGVAGGVALLLLVVFGGWVGMAFLAAGLSVAMANEFSKIIYTLPDASAKRYGLLTVAWFASLVNGFVPSAEFEVLLTCFFIATIGFLISAKQHEKEAMTWHFRELMFTFFGLFYTVFLIAHLPKLHALSQGVHWTILFLLIIWCGDTGAYFGGKKYGKRKLYPEISPNKTIEGSAFGLLAGLLVCVLYKLTLFKGANWAAVLLIPLVVGAIAQLGDLVESFLKRAFSVKDSGSLLPGHGGVLDRFDSVIYSVPVMVACVRVLGS